MVGWCRSCLFARGICHAEEMDESLPGSLSHVDLTCAWPTRASRFKSGLCLQVASEVYSSSRRKLGVKRCDCLLNSQCRWSTRSILWLGLSFPPPSSLSPPNGNNNRRAGANSRPTATGIWAWVRPSASDGWMRFYSIDRGIWASPPPKMTIFSTGEVFVVILPAAERFGVAYNASQFGSFVTKRQIPSALLVL